MSGFLTAQIREGKVFVDTGVGPIFWPADLCERLAAEWEPRGGSWATDAETLRAAAEQARSAP